MNVNLTPEQEQIVKDELKSGHFHSVEEVIGEALQVLRANSTIGVISPLLISLQPHGPFAIGCFPQHGSTVFQAQSPFSSRSNPPAALGSGPSQ